MKQPPGGGPGGAGLRVLVLRSAFNAPVVAGLARGCVEELLSLATAPSRIESLEVPGAFELPLAAQGNTIPFILLREYPEVGTPLPVMGGMKQKSAGPGKIWFLAFNKRY